MITSLKVDRIATPFSMPEIPGSKHANSNVEFLVNFLPIYNR
jgi:hypothetical protein